MEQYNYNGITPPPLNNESAVARQTTSVMKRVYVRMFLGLLISAFCALGVASSPALSHFFFGNQVVFWVMMIAIVAMAWILPSAMRMVLTGAIVA